MDFTKNPFDAQTLHIVIFAEKNNGGAAFTVRSKATGKDFTFKINRSEFNGKWYTHVKVEKEYLNFVYLGSYFNGGMFKKRQLIKTPAALAIAWVLKMIENQKFDILKDGVDLMHLGNCLRCGRPLTDADSIQRGLGPICQSM